MNNSAMKTVETPPKPIESVKTPPVKPIENNKSVRKPSGKSIATLALTKPGMNFTGLIKNSKGYDVVQFRIIPPSLKTTRGPNQKIPKNKMSAAQNLRANIERDPCKRKLVRQALTMQGVSPAQRLRFLTRIGCNIPRQMHTQRR